MALLGYEGFELLSSGVDIFNKPFGTGMGQQVSGGAWLQITIGGIATTAGQTLNGYSGNKLSLSSNSQMAMQLTTLTYPRLIVGARIQPTASTGIFTFSDSSTTQCGLNINASLNLFVWRGTTATVLATGSATLVIGTYYYVEIDITVNNTNGAAKVVINGNTSSPDINASGLNTRNGSNNQLNRIAFNNSGINFTASIDDFYVVDPSAGSPTTMLGPCRVETVYPSSNNSVQWTPLSGTNVSQINAVTNNQGTTYNSTAAAGVQDTFTHGALSSIPAAIYAVAVVVSAEKTDVSICSLQSTLISGSVTQQGAAQNVVTTYIYQKDVYQTDPNTGVAWLPAAVNATDIGYKRVT